MYTINPRFPQPFTLCSKNDCFAGSAKSSVKYLQGRGGEGKDLISNVLAALWYLKTEFVDSINIRYRKLSLLAVKQVILFCTVNEHGRTITFLAVVALLIDRKAFATVVWE